MRRRRVSCGDGKKWRKKLNIDTLAKVAHLLEQKPIYGEKSFINLRAIVSRQWLIRTSSNVIDAIKGSKQSICRVPPGSFSVVADAIMRHVQLMIVAHEAIHGGAETGHVVCLNGGPVVGHCEIMDPFSIYR